MVPYRGNCQLHRAEVLQLRGEWSEALGAVLLAEGNPREALNLLRQGWSAWSDLDAPYEAARARLCIAVACREQGDQDAAALEFSAARKVFETLGAKPGLERLERLANPLLTCPQRLLLPARSKFYSSSLPAPPIAASRRLWASARKPAVFTLTGCRGGFFFAQSPCVAQSTRSVTRRQKVAAVLVLHPVMY
jgi:tetratricopeptide (TPR) repeat protein